MRPTRLAPLVLVAVIAAACGSSGGAATPSAVAPVASVLAQRIEVKLSDALKIEPSTMAVTAGQPVTFVVTNSGTALHEFVLGDEADQQAHDKEMMAAGGMSMPKDEPMAIGVEPGKTKELTVTFEKAGAVLAGCHVVGHYAAGMKSMITIE